MTIKVLHIVPRNVNSGPVNVASDIVEGLKEIEINAALFPVRNSKGVDLYGLFFSIYKLMKVNENVVLHSHGIIPDIVCWLITFFSKNNWVSTVHIDPFEDLKFLYPRTYKLVYKFWFFILKKAGRVVVLTEFIRNKVPLCNTTCVINSRRLDICEDSISRVNSQYIKNKPVLGFCGAFIERKNIYNLVSTMCSLNDIKIIIAGDGPQKDKLYDVSKNSENIMFMGFQSDLTAFWRAIDILILPSFAEGVPLAAIEALAHKKPIILMNLPNYGGVFSDQEAVFIDDVSGEAINKAVSDITFNYTRYSENAERAYGTTFNYQAWINKYVDIYNSFLINSV